MKTAMSYIKAQIREMQHEMDNVSKQIHSLQHQILSLEKEKDSLTEAIDDVYTLFSASHTLHDTENTEISTLKELIVDKSAELSVLCGKRDQISMKIQELEQIEVLEDLPVTDKIVTSDVTLQQIFEKFDFIDKIILIDPHRARQELSIIKDLLSHLYS